MDRDIISNGDDNSEINDKSAKVSTSPIHYNSGIDSSRSLNQVNMVVSGQGSEERTHEGAWGLGSMKPNLYRSSMKDMPAAHSSSITNPNTAINQSFLSSNITNFIHSNTINPKSIDVGANISGANAASLGAAALPFDASVPAPTT